MQNSLLTASTFLSCRSAIRELQKHTICAGRVRTRHPPPWGRGIHGQHRAAPGEASSGPSAANLLLCTGEKYKGGKKKKMIGFKHS